MTTNNTTPSVNIIGFGIMGQQIAALFSSLGASVYIWDKQRSDRKRIDFYHKLLQKKLELNAKPLNISFCHSMDELKGNITLEVITENLVLKKKIYEDIRKHSSVPFFTNTSSILPSEIGDDVYGCHFFNPIFSLKFVEIYKPNNQNNIDSFPELNLLETAGYNLIEVKNSPGYVGNYILFSQILATLKLLDNYHYETETLDKITVSLFNQNILETIDIIGLDIVRSILQHLSFHDSMFFVPKILDQCIEENILGKKNKTSLKKWLKKQTESIDA